MKKHISVIALWWFNYVDINGKDLMGLILS